MKYVLTESQYKKLNEAVGVPTNIVDIARQLYDKMMSELKPTTKLKSFIKKPIVLKGNFQINDYKFDTINLEFNVDSLDEYDVNGDSRQKIYLRGMTHRSTVEMNNKFNYTTNRDMDVIDLSINMTLDNDATTQDLIDEFKKEKVVIISSLAHEIKHGYDESVNPNLKTNKRVEYQIGSQRQFGNIPPLNKLLHYMYFAHTTENLVRATELYAALEEEGITKEDFYKFITNNKVYEIYKDGANLTYEKLRDDLKKIIPQIKETFDDNNINYPEDASDDEMVDVTLKEFFKTLLNWRAGTMKSYLTQEFIEELFGFSGKKQKYFDKYLDRVTRFGGDYEKFIKYEINQTRNICLKMTKKLSKLYSLLKNKNNPL
jgi:hypothetical protein